jgi:hypothetical protein
MLATEPFFTTLLECSNRDFSTIGCPINPLPDSLTFYETHAVIPEAPEVPPLAPLSALALSLSNRTYGLLLSHDSITRCLPGYSFTNESKLDPKTHTFLLDWAFGRLAFHMAGEKGLSELPQAIRIGEQPLPLRSLLALSYALERNPDAPVEAATILCNYIGISAGSADSAILNTSSSIVRRKLSTRYPGIETLDSCLGTRRFFEANPVAAKAFMTELQKLLSNQIKTIKEEDAAQKSRKNPNFSI